MESAIERDPAYPTWEAERVALATRRTELADQIASFCLSAADVAYQDALKEGFDEAHAQEKADAILAEGESMRSEMRRVDLRLSIIKPLVNVERCKQNGDANRSQYQETLLNSLERIATALERLTGTCGTSRKPRSKAGAA